MKMETVGQWSSLLLLLLFMAGNSWLGEAQCYKPEGRGVWFPMKSLNFFFFFNLPNLFSCIMTLELTQSLTEMSTRIFCGEVKRSLRVSSPQSLTRLSCKCGSLDISQSNRPPRPVIGIPLFYFSFLQRQNSL
jgi:hypothetical protein